MHRPVLQTVLDPRIVQNKLIVFVLNDVPTATLYYFQFHSSIDHFSTPRTLDNRQLGIEMKNRRVRIAEVLRPSSPSYPAFRLNFNHATEFKCGLDRRKYFKCHVIGCAWLPIKLVTSIQRATF